MVHLFLSEPDWSFDGDDDSFKQRVSLLNDLEGIMRILIASQSRSEARFWLCNDISGISSLSSRQQRELFMNLLQTSSQKKDLAAQLLQMIFQKQPRKAGSILAKKSHMLEDFFRGNPRRILHWFSNFSGTSDMEHRKGAKALSQFAFVNRDICWEELEWKGKHGQSPAMVATKPHYFLDLDVEQTVENFLENVPEFWSSHEFANTLEDGDILCLDMKFFVNRFVKLMYKEDMEEIWKVINEFLMEEAFSSLCCHLLIALTERELCFFLDLLQESLNLDIKPKVFGDRCQYLEVILSRYSGSDSMDELLLLNAVINRGRQVVQLLQDDEHKDEKLQIKDIVQKIFKMPANPDGLVPLIKQCSNKKSTSSIKLLALHSWALHYFLTEEYGPPEAWESLFSSNGVSFRHSGKHELLHHNGLPDDSDSESDGRLSSSSKRKKKRNHRKKRRKSSTLDDSNDDDLLDLDFLYDKMDRQSKPSYWLLSTDGYSTSWSSVDLPEHLSKHCFSTWMKWGFSR
uniref:uncharacterized protein LOC122580878 n=1 Tax=Erigeron canadensis TaxID=72917 RepID=UPI001CB95E70|nr:uncharacterized protein LOC122580878 [Erigeron canadensis]XP_043608963.1 uncharacterized protein LOC122580878 [Erigeron canadensis]XP_043608964.1 uncharacterized protein LOC122580878 [Erigeron canadensis]